MSNSLFEHLKQALNQRLVEILPALLPDGRFAGREYVCGSLSGGACNSCKTNLDSGRGSDFATSETWGDIIALATKIWRVRPLEAAQRLAKMFSVAVPESGTRAERTQRLMDKEHFQVIQPIPDNVPDLLPGHLEYGTPSHIWWYKDAQSRTLFAVCRFDKANGKAIVPICFGRDGQGHEYWRWCAVPAPRPLYGLDYLAASDNNKPVLVVEGEKTAEAARKLFSEYVCMCWSGGANAVAKSDWSPLEGRSVTIWPDNDEPGLKAAVDILHELSAKKAKEAKIVFPLEGLPEKWDVADPAPAGFDINAALGHAVNSDEFLRTVRIENCETDKAAVEAASDEELDLDLAEWPELPEEALPGFAGEFVALATKESEGDPAAVLSTLLCRFAAEVYGYAPGKGPYLFIGDTRHAPRIFVVICGNSSKARKGTSCQPVIRLFQRNLCTQDELSSLSLLPSSQESGEPLSSGEGLGYPVRDRTGDDGAPFTDKRLYILDEELASGLSCTRREGNTLSMAIRTFWDGNAYAPLTKNNPVKISGAHICIVTHITQLELDSLFSTVNMANGFGNRFLWICARRKKLVALPRPMPEAELSALQLRLWRLVKRAQETGEVTLEPEAVNLWRKVYPELTKESPGLVGAITARAEAGLEINRESRDFITFMAPEGGEKIRLKGGVYGADWELNNVGRTVEGENRAGKGAGEPALPERIVSLERELADAIQKRAGYNDQRYNRRSPERVGELAPGLPDIEQVLWEGMAADGPDRAGSDSGDMARDIWRFEMDNLSDSNGANRTLPDRDGHSGAEGNSLEATEQDLWRDVTGESGGKVYRAPGWTTPKTGWKLGEQPAIKLE